MNGTGIDPQLEAITQLYLTTSTLLRPFIIQTSLFAVYTVLIIWSSYVLINKGLVTRAQTVLLAVTLLMYINATLHWAFSFHPLLTVSADRGATIESIIASCTSPDPSTCPKIVANSINFGIARIGADPFHWAGTETALILTSILLSDAIVMWRSWILWERSVFIKTVSVMLLLGTLVTGFVHIYRPLHFRRPDMIFGGDILFLDNWGISTLVLSLFANLWAVSLVAVKFWIHRRMFVRYLQSAQSTTSVVDRLCLILLETGTPYFCVAALFLISCLLGSREGDSNVFFDLIIYGDIQFVGIYPTIIIILASLGRIRTKDLTQGGAEASEIRFKSFAHPVSQHTVGHGVVHERADEADEGADESSRDHSSKSPSRTTHDFDKITFV